MVMGIEKWRDDASETKTLDSWIEHVTQQFGHAISEDLNTSEALLSVETVIATKGPKRKLSRLLTELDSVIGLKLLTLTRSDLRIRPITATITEAEIESALHQRKEARAAKDFAKSDAIRDDLIAKGVEVMDGDPLGWDWRIDV
jgi:cysteinyl-tRNA synthetase